MAADVADAVVVGSGAAGAALTWRLAEHGAKVVCLEQGDWISRDALPSTRREVETFLRRGPSSFSPNTRHLPQDYPVSTVGISPAQMVMFNGVGSGDEAPTVPKRAANRGNTRAMGAPHSRH